MIDQDTEYNYNIMLSVFLGIFIVLVLWHLFTKPREVEIIKIDE